MSHPLTQIGLRSYNDACKVPTVVRMAKAIRRDVNIQENAAKVKYPFRDIHDYSLKITPPLIITPSCLLQKFVTEVYHPPHDLSCI